MKVLLFIFLAIVAIQATHLEKEVDYEQKGPVIEEIVQKLKEAVDARADNALEKIQNSFNFFLRSIGEAIARNEEGAENLVDARLKEIDDLIKKVQEEQGIDATECRDNNIKNIDKLKIEYEKNSTDLLAQSKDELSNTVEVGSDEIGRIRSDFENLVEDTNCNDALSCGKLIVKYTAAAAASRARIALSTLNIRKNQLVLTTKAIAASTGISVKYLIDAAGVADVIIKCIDDLVNGGH